MDDRIWVETGKILHSASGRQLSPAPKIDCTTDRKCTKTEQRLYTWLREEAMKEAQLLRNELAYGNIKSINVKNISQSDVEVMNMVLFDEEFAAIPIPRKIFNDGI